MEIVTMGKVLVPARIENLRDALAAEEGTLALEQVRTIEVPDALVDTGATYLSMPPPLIRQLGLRQRGKRVARTAAGSRTFGIYEPVRLTVQGRECLVEVADLPDECPVLIGQVPLEILDFVVDASGRKLIGNPEHGGEQMFDLF
jgi:predicted aspartyl protease